MKLSKQLQVFLLYSRKDEEAVRGLYRRMIRLGANVWLDRKKLLPGQDWQYEIRKAIHNSDVIIACLSRQFNKQGGYRHEELKIALRRARALSEGKIFIIPARLENCDMPVSLRRWQRVDLFEPHGYEELANTLNEIAH